MSSVYYNEGVGQGGFIGTFATAGAVVIESWDPDKPSSHLIQQPDQFGGPLKQAGVAGFQSCQAVVQLPFNGATVTEIQLGDTVTAPADHGGGTWFVSHAGETFRVGDYFKSNLQLQRVTGT